MTEMRELHRRALEGFDRRVRAVREDQWTAPTPCAEWDVRGLVDHLVVEQLWVPPLLAGETVAEVGDRFDGDRLGSDPVAAWGSSSAAAAASVAEEGALERIVHLSYGDRPAVEYVREMVVDTVVHTWDLARATGGDERLDPELVELAYGQLEPVAERWREAGLLGPAVPVADGAGRQAGLLGLAGRQA